MTELTCPKCGNKFEIEDSESTKEKLAEVQEAHDRQLEAQEEKYQKDKNRDVEKGIKEELEALNKKAEREQQAALDAQQKEFQKGEDSRIETEVNKKSVAAEKKLKKNYEQEMQQIIIKERRENNAADTKKDNIHKLEMERLGNKIQELKRTIDDTQKNELKGESAEDWLKGELKNRFPKDEIVDIPKGVRGADLMQKVHLNKREIGMILIECKSTGKFYQAWIEKLREDCERSGSKIGVLVTQTLPKEYNDRLYFEAPPNIHVIQTMIAVDIITGLRREMIENHIDKLSGKAAKDKKMETQVLKYLTTEGRKIFLELSKKILQDQKLIDSDEKENDKNIKKRRKNLNSLIEIFRKLINGLGNASQHGFDLDEVSPILITEKIDD